MVSFDPRLMVTHRFELYRPEKERLQQAQREEFILFKTVEILLHMNVDEETMRQQLVRAFDFRYTEATMAINDVRQSLDDRRDRGDGHTVLTKSLPVFLFSCCYTYRWPQGDFDLCRDTHETIAVYCATQLLLRMKAEEDVILRELMWAFDLNDRQAASALTQIKQLLGIKET